MAALPRLRIKPSRRSLIAPVLVVLAIIVALVAGAGGAKPAAESAAAADRAPAAGYDAPAPKSRPKVVQAVAPGQDAAGGPDSAPSDARAAADPGDAPSPGAASDAEIKRELAGLGNAGGGADAAILRPDGQAIAPSEAPAAVKLVVDAGNTISNAPYKWGGGHGKWLDNGYDCSGSVSFALASGGLLDGPLDSSGLARWGAKGPGKWITVYANPGHVYMMVAGVRFDTSGRSKRGSRWQVASRSGGSYSVRHPPGL